MGVSLKGSPQKVEFQIISSCRSLEQEKDKICLPFPTRQVYFGRKDLKIHGNRGRYRSCGSGLWDEVFPFAVLFSCLNQLPFCLHVFYQVFTPQEPKSC